MDDADAHPAESRAPTLEDLLTLCRSLNAHGVRYMVIGGFAIIQHGFPRGTMDIDLLLAEDLENQARVKAALQILPDRAILELGDEDLRDYIVVRVADEVTVDLMLAACGIAYAEACAETVHFTIRGVRIPFASLGLMWRMKQTLREKDAQDRLFLHRKLSGQSFNPLTGEAGD